MRRRVVIDPGHGGRDTGAIFSTAIEKEINLAIGREMMNIMRGEFTVIPTRVTDIYVSLSRRWEMANQMKADAFVSIHCNADMDADTQIDPVAKGAEIWVFPHSLRSLRLAGCIQRYVPNFAPVWRGIKESATLAVLRNTSMAAALVEVGFVDDPTFSHDPDVEKIGFELSQGVSDFLRSLAGEGSFFV